MRFNCSTWTQVKARKSAWHVWFAWHPVHLSNGKCAWLERVWRKGVYFACYADDGWDWEYRAIEEMKRG